MARRARRIVFLVVCAALLFVAPQAVGTPSWLGDVPGLGNAADDLPPTKVAFGLDGCTISNPLYNLVNPLDTREPERVDEFVPDDYQLATNAFFPTGATVIAAFLSCDHVTPSNRSAALMVVAIQVVPRPRPGDLADQLWQAYERSTLNFLPSSSWYIVGAETNNAQLQRRLVQSGLPVAFDSGLTHWTDYDAPLKLESDGAPPRLESDGASGNAFTLETHTELPDPFVHNHDWFFWYGSGADARSFLLHLHAMTDSSCGYHFSRVTNTVQDACGATLTAPAGTPIERLLGSPASTPYAFNHPPTSTWGYIDLPERTDGTG